MRITLFAFAVSTAWIQLAPITVARQEVAVAAAAGRIYVIGGIGEGGTILSSVEAYDPETDRWIEVAPLPEPLHHAAAATVDDQIYVIGGYRTIAFDATDAVYRYDPVADRWTPIARLPRRLAALAAAAIGRKIYAVGGAPPATGELTVYDVDAGVWTTLAPMPTPREHLAAGVLEGKLYVAGGRSGGFSGLSGLEEYDPETDTWRARATMPTARGGIAAAVAMNRLYVFGGEGNANSSNGVFPHVESYDPVTDRWRSEIPMPTPRHGIGAATIGDRIYVPAGATVQGFGTSAANEAYIPAQFRMRRRAARR